MSKTNPASVKQRQSRVRVAQLDHEGTWFSIGAGPFRTTKEARNWIRENGDEKATYMTLIHTGTFKVEVESTRTVKVDTTVRAFEIDGEEKSE